jgi:hypothetical protein
VGAALTPEKSARLLRGASLRFGNVTDPGSVARDGFRGERFDAVVSCLASRTGASEEAWAIDYRAHMNSLAAAEDAGISQMVLLSAICVQKPLFAFQRAKLAFWGLGALGRFNPRMAEEAEMAPIGRYYATESMLVLNPATERYDADATPSVGSETLFDFYARVINGEASFERGDHGVF